jgi:predicted nuclease of restriction endonuclease-like (RecB) superfamily
MSKRDIAPGWQESADNLLGRIAGMLEAARGQVVRTVNAATVATYRYIGRELVEAVQQGDERAAYGKALIARLAERLTARYGKGYSATNLGYFRRFYLTYADRIPHPPGEESSDVAAIQIYHPPGDKSEAGFHPNLSWSHYRALMRVSDAEARSFYEAEAVRANWSRRDLERQINSLYHQRLLASSEKPGMLQSQHESGRALRPVDMLKDPYVLEFLDLPNAPRLHESQLEDAIITRLQQFLLDQDIGQMDGYVRLYEEQHRIAGDNPTIGLILCSEKNEAVARYSVLHESEQLFASRYRFTLPSEEELQRELERERALIENQADCQTDSDA